MLVVAVELPSLLVVVGGVLVGLWWLHRRLERKRLEAGFGHLRGRREVPAQTYRLEDVMEAVNKQCL